jgi:hypothetical protein
VIPLTWKRVDAQADPDFVVAPDERLDWARTIGIGAQHVVAMFGATFLVPVLTGFPPATTLLPVSARCCSWSSPVTGCPVTSARASR